MLETESKLTAGQDFYVGYSPERINPGDPNHRFETILKIVSAQCSHSLKIVATILSECEHWAETIFKIVSNR